MDYKTETTPRRFGAGAEEITILQLFLILWNSKRWIIAGTSIVTFLGILYALFATPVYYSEAIISPKEAGKGNDASRIFSQLGGMGGIVASQFGVGNANLDKIEVILKGHELADSVIRKNNLLPVLYPELWNAKDSSWIPENPKNIPTLRQGINALRGEVLIVSSDIKKNLIRIGAYFRDSSIAKQLVDFYLIELNNKIRNDAMQEAESNREYLENQLLRTSDPVLVQKIQSMVGFEIEKYMLVSSRAFEILDPPVVPMIREKPKRKVIAVLSLLLGFALSSTGIFLWRGFRVLRNGQSAFPSP